MADFPPQVGTGIEATSGEKVSQGRPEASQGFLNIPSRGEEEVSMVSPPPPSPAEMSLWRGSALAAAPRLSLSVTAFSAWVDEPQGCFL